MYCPFCGIHCVLPCKAHRHGRHVLTLPGIAEFCCKLQKDARSFGCFLAGSTSAKAAAKLGLSKVFHPDKPGLKGFAASIKEALESHGSMAA